MQRYCSAFHALWVDLGTQAISWIAAGSPGSMLPVLLARQELLRIWSRILSYFLASWLYCTTIGSMWSSTESFWILAYYLSRANTTQGA